MNCLKVNRGIILTYLIGSFLFIGCTKKNPCSKPYDVPACFEQTNKTFEEMKTVEGQKGLVPIFKGLCENEHYYKSCIVCYSLIKESNQYDLRIKFAKLIEKNVNKACKEGDQTACNIVENAKKIVAGEEAEKIRASFEGQYR